MVVIRENMNLYSLYPQRTNTSFAFYLKGNNIDTIRDYFVYNETTDFLKKPRINLTFDTTFGKIIPDVLAKDFYFCSSSLWLFSSNFYEKANTFLQDDGQFFECLLNNEPCGIYTFYIQHSANLENIFHDKETTSAKILRDINEPYSYAVSQEFVDFCKKNKFKINYFPFSEKSFED